MINNIKKMVLSTIGKILRDEYGLIVLDITGDFSDEGKGFSFEAKVIAGSATRFEREAQIEGTLDEYGCVLYDEPEEIILDDED